MQAMIQTNYQGIDAIQLLSVPNSHRSPIGTLVDVAYVPVLPWDIMRENGQLMAEAGGQLPKILGYGFSGIVRQSGLMGLAPGTRVAGASPAGSYAEIVNAPIPLYLFPLPDEVSLASAATIFGGSDTATMMIDQANIHSTSTVLVVGVSGSVGDYLVQLLSHLGVHVTILSSRRSLDYTRTRFPDIPVIQTPADLADSTLDTILDTSGNTRLLNQLEPKLKSGGILFPAGLPNYLSHRTDIHSIFYNKPLYPKRYHQIIDQLATGELTATIQQTLPLSETPRAQHLATELPARGRILVQVADFE